MQRLGKISDVSMHML